MHLGLRGLRAVGEIVESVEKSTAPVGLVGDEGEVAETELVERVGKNENIGFLRVLDFPADGPIFIHFKCIEHEVDQDGDSFLLLPFLVASGDQPLQLLFSDCAPVFGNGF